MTKLKKILSPLLAIFLVFALIYIIVDTAKDSSIERQEQVGNDLIKTIDIEHSAISYNLKCIEGIWYFSGSRYMAPKYDKDTLKPETCGQKK